MRIGGQAGVEWVVAISVLAALAGCGTNPGGAGSDDGSDGVGEIEDGNRGDIPDDVSGKLRGEPNGQFSEAILAVFDDDRRAALGGTISSAEDVDTYHLGQLVAGDRVTIDATTPGSSLDVAISLFDDRGRLVYYNDDAHGATLEARIEHVVRHEGSPYYLVVGASYFHQTASEGRGTYQVDIIVESGADVPPPVGQTLFLEFRGGTVTSPTMGQVTLAPFDAADIHSRYTGRTQTMKDTIRAMIAHNFKRFNVTVLTSDEFTPGPDERVSTLYFGGYRPDVFGESEHIDWYNANCCDDAIIYVESFNPDEVFFRIPSVTGMCRAIANVATHEAGHNLGLNHVDDDTDIMDTQSAAEALLRIQEFKESPLSEQIAPLGTQDAVLLLLEALGAPVPP